MASKLLDRLNAVFTDGPLTEVQGLHGSMGNPIADLKTLVVHETSGFPPSVNGRNMFVEHFKPQGDGITSSLYVAGDGTVMQGMQLPNRTAHAGFVNDRSIGCETGHGWGNYKFESHIGPFTSTDESVIPDPAHPGKFIPGPTNGSLLAAPLAKAFNFWRALSGNEKIDDATDDDLPGLKFYVRVRSFNEVALSIWTTARYAGPWRQPQRVPEMLFNEPHYRSWAMLARWIAEEFVLPRNFPLLPHKLRSSGHGTSGDHGTLTDATTFSAIVLADESLARSPHTFGLPTTPPIPSAADLLAAYLSPAPGTVNAKWKAMFDVYRGFHGHGFSGDPSPKLDDHDCPGPMFDWYRFAREVWDWWWWPFDFDTANATTAVAARPYSLPTRDGNTPLKEYYWATPATVPRGRARTGIHGAASSPLTFELPDGSRVYAVANGELVAARFPVETGQPSLAFVLVRHEVWHKLDVRAPAAGTPTSVPIFANRIDYDAAPTTVYTLYMHLGRPTGMDFTAVSDTNPDWLNRVLARKKECDLGVQFNATDAAKPATAADKIPAAIWNYQPASTPQQPPTRPSLATAWQADQTALTTFLNALSAGNIATAPNDANTTPIRILLGDFMANAGVVARDHASTTKGVRVEVFSKDLISATAFALTDSTGTPGTGWTAQVGVAAPAQKYASEWARVPTGAELTALQVAGVDTTLINWWQTVGLATTNARYPTDARLDASGVVVHYELCSFMTWLNLVTWHSEWPKYRATDPAGVPATPRPR